MKKFFIFIITGILWGNNFPGFKSTWKIEGVPYVDSLFTLNLGLKEMIGKNWQFKIELYLPIGAHLLNGSSQIQVQLNPYDSLTISYTLKIDYPSNYDIFVKILPLGSDTTSFLNRFKCHYYIIYKEGSLFYYGMDDTEFEEIDFFMPYRISEIINVGEGPFKSSFITVYGSIKYNDGGTIKPLRKVKLEGRAFYSGSENSLYFSLYADDNGNYSIQIPRTFFSHPLAGIYIKIYAQNTVGEIHDFWDVDKGVFWCQGYPHFVRINFSPPTYEAKVVQINAGPSSPDSIEVSHIFDGEQAAWGKLLEIILDCYKETQQKTGTTPPYVEVAYPAEVPFPGEATFYFPAGKLHDLDVYVEMGQMHTWIDICFRRRAFHQICISPYEDVFTNEGIVTVTHEWPHAFMVKILGDKIPDTWEWAEHYFNQPFPDKPGMAFAEGFADFWAGALWIDEMDTNIEYITTEQLEEYYQKYNDIIYQPFWKGEPPDFSNTDGRIVEGSVFQFLWDLFDDKNTKDHSPNFDDDGYYGNIDRIENTISSLKDLLTEVITDFYISLEEPIPTPLGNVTKIHLGGKTALFIYWSGGQLIWSWEFMDKFKEKWFSLNYGNIDEIWNINFFGIKPPSPTNFTGSVSENTVILQWNDNAMWEGAYILKRRKEGGNFWTTILLSKNITSYIDQGLAFNTKYYYKVAALTCDTSGWAGPISVTTNVLNPPTNLQATSSSPYNSVYLTWQDNSNYETGYEVWRKGLDNIWRKMKNFKKILDLFLPLKVFHLLNLYLINLKINTSPKCYGIIHQFDKKFFLLYNVNVFLKNLTFMEYYMYIALRFKFTKGGVK